MQTMNEDSYAIQYAEMCRKQDNRIMRKPVWNCITAQWVLQEALQTAQ